MSKEPRPRTETPLHEPDQPSVRLLVVFGIALFVSIAIVLIFAGWSFYRFAGKVSRTEAPAPRLSRAELPPEPRLQVNPQQDLRRMREQENQHLNTYRWTNRPEGRISVPIDRALDYVARHGLPGTRAEAGAGKQ
jgi:hypothetical protein